MSTRYCLAQDNSGQWYVINAKDRNTWNTWLNLSEDDAASWEPPCAATAVDGYHRVTFSDWKTDP